jgi:hypothetical protein
VAVRYGYRIQGRVEIRGFADVKSGDDFTFSPIFDKKMSVAFQVYHEGIQSGIHSLPDSESMDLEGLFSFSGWLRFLKE